MAQYQSMANSLLHISDLHFGPYYMAQIGEEVLRFAAEKRPEAIVISGDFTQRAKRSQFQEAKRFLNRLPSVPTITVPGNHDVPLYRVLERLLKPHSLYQEYIHSELDYSFQDENLSIVALDSTAPYTATKNGWISENQLLFAARAFEKGEKSAFRIVVAHHHFAPAPDYERSKPMPFAKRALDAFLEMGVHLVLGGHLHRAYIGNSLDVYPGKNRERGIIIVQCGTTTSMRGRGKERAKNSLNMLYFEGDTIRIVHYLYMEKHFRRFVPVSEHVFPRPGVQSLVRFEAEESDSNGNITGSAPGSTR
jgi:predicted phosphodiesterase